MDEQYIMCDMCGANSSEPDCPPIYMIAWEMDGYSGTTACRPCFRHLTERDPVDPIDD